MIGTWRLNLDGEFLSFSWVSFPILFDWIRIYVLNTDPKWIRINNTVKYIWLKRKKLTIIFICSGFLGRNDEEPVPTILPYHHHPAGIGNI